MGISYAVLDVLGLSSADMLLATEDYPKRSACCTLHNNTAIKDEDSPYQNAKLQTMHIGDKHEAQHCAQLLLPIEGAGCQWDVASCGATC